MKAAAWAALLVLCAGCLGGTDAPVETDAPPVANGPAPVATTPDPNATYLQNTDYSQAHIHDYWDGAAQKELMNEPVEVSAIASAGFTAFSVFIDGRPRTGVGTAFFTLPNMTIVPEGAGELVVEADGTAAVKQGGMALSYRAADSGEFVALEPLGADARWAIPLTPTMADLPHARSTRWEFRLDAADGSVLDGAVNVRITAVRMHDIEAWPLHEDPWDAGALTKLDLGNTTGSYDIATQHLVGIEDNAAFPEILPASIVPPETQALVVTLRYERSSDPKNTINGPVILIVKDGATSRGHRVMHGNVIKDEPGVKVYALPVDEATADSPYATESAWSFQLHAPFGVHDVPPDGRTIDIGGLDVGSGTYDVGIVAYRVVPPWLAEVLPDCIGRSC